MLNRTNLSHNAILDKITKAQLNLQAIPELGSQIVLNCKGLPFIEVVIDKVGGFHYYCLKTKQNITKRILNAQGIKYYE